MFWVAIAGLVFAGVILVIVVTLVDDHHESKLKREQIRDKIVRSKRRRDV